MENDDKINNNIQNFYDTDIFLFIYNICNKAKVN